MLTLTLSLVSAALTVWAVWQMMDVAAAISGDCGDE